MSLLNSQQRKFLRSKAHKLEASVLIGKQGVTDTVIQSVSEALDAHELIKIRFNEHKEDKQALSQEIAERTKCNIAGIIGHVLIVYRQHKDKDKRRIVLPA